jgi:phenylacetate-CoA ligase
MIPYADTAISLAQIKVNQWKAADEIASIQEERLRDLLSHACSEVPYYRKTDGYAPVSLGDLHTLPLVRKEDVQKRNQEFVDRRHDPASLTEVHTSGSTGMPLTLFQTKGEDEFVLGLEVHYLTQAGLRPFDVQARLAHYTGGGRFLQRMGIFRTNYLSPHADGRNTLAELRRMGPRAIYSTPNTIALLANENLASKAGIGIDLAFTFAEMLTERTRRFISESFGSRVFDLYGAAEAGYIAGECEEGSLHINSDSVIVEITDEKGRPVPHGEYGYVVVTPLWKRSMPMIRYFLGDQTAFGGECRCGRGLPTLKRIEGRKDDFIVLPSGKLVTARPIHWSLRRPSEILMFQAVQDAPGELHISVVPKRRCQMEPVRQRLISDLQSYLPEPMRITMEMVDEIPPGKRLKRQVFISRIRNPGF